MPIDLNDTAPAERPLFDLDDLSARLAASASSWVPQYFQNGRINDDRTELRVADITGRAPKKTGSCVIGLAGELAGTWHDFGTGEGGAPLSTLKHASGKEGRELLDLAAEIVGTSAPQARRIGGNVLQTAVQKAPRDSSAEIAHILARSVPLAGTLAETYLKSRGLEDPKSEDLRFCENVTDWKAGVGRPAMIAIPRLADGTPTGGVHRTFLAYDGSGKAEMESPKKMLGAMENGAVRLAQMGADGKLGVAEGCETALAAMQLYDLPVWAATAAAFVGSWNRNGEWIGFVPPEGVTALYIFADKGKAGLKAAEALAVRTTAAGIPAAVIEPVGDDDFNADLLAGGEVPALPDLTVAPEPAAPEPTVETTADMAAAIALAIGALAKKSSPEEIDGVLGQIATASPDMVATRQMLVAVRDRTKLPLRALEAALKKKRLEIRATTAKKEGGWMAKMILSDGGEPRTVLENAATVLEFAAEFQGVLWFDEFGNRPMMRRPAPWDAKNGHFTERPWTDADDAEATRWLQRAGVLTPMLITHDAALTVAHKTCFHPVREYLEGLEWDGKPRLDFWAIDYLGAEESAYTRAVSARWIISAVARVMVPGVKADHILILEGLQGTYKSTTLRVLFDPWFSDDPVEIGTKDASIQLSGIWCLEYADLDRFGRADRNRLKAFVSRQVDRYRPPFGRYAADYPRQLVFAATTNESAFLDDPTGGRRFWPIKSPSPNPAGLLEVKHQIWAEAFVRYKAGEKFYLAETDLQEAAAKQQRARQSEESWGHSINSVLQGGDMFYPKDAVTIHEILEEMRIPRDRWNASTHNRVRDYLQFIGWVRDDSSESEHRFLRPK